MSVIHQSVLAALRKAGEDGLSEGEIAQEGGRWWRRHVADINRWKLAAIGWDRVDSETRYFLVSTVSSGASSDTGRSSDDGRVDPSGLGGQTGGEAPEETVLTLFPSRVIAGSPYDLGEAA